jgi:hypothetical protein
MRRMTSRGTVAAASLDWESAPAKLESRAACMAKTAVAKSVVFVLAGVRFMKVISQRAEYAIQMRARLCKSSDEERDCPLTRK